MAAALALMPPVSPARKDIPVPDRTFIYSDVDSVVYIESDRGACSGTVIESPYTKEALVLTAAHCVMGVSYVGARFEEANGKYFWSKLTVVYVGEPGSRTDIALLRGDTHGADPIKLADKFPAFPVPGHFFGYAGSDTEMMMPCFLMDDLGPYGMVGLGEVRSGDSGGGVTGKNGRLIGVVWGGVRDDPFTMLIAPVDAVHAALKTLNK